MCILICLLGILNTFAIRKRTLLLEVLIDSISFPEASVCPVYSQTRKPGRRRGPDPSSSPSRHGSGRAAGPRGAGGARRRPVPGPPRCSALSLPRGSGRGAPAASPRTFLGLAGAAPLVSPGRYRIPPRRMISLEVLPRSPSKCALVLLS